MLCFSQSCRAGWMSGWVEVVIFMVLGVWLSLENCKKHTGSLAVSDLNTSQGARSDTSPRSGRSERYWKRMRNTIKWHQLRTSDTPTFLTDSCMNCEKAGVHLKQKFFLKSFFFGRSLFLYYCFLVTVANEAAEAWNALCMMMSV